MSMYPGFSWINEFYMLCGKINDFKVLLVERRKWHTGYVDRMISVCYITLSK